MADGTADEVVEDIMTLCYARLVDVNGMDLERLSAGEVESDSGLIVKVGD